jgi:hypothetical protein
MLGENDRDRLCPCQAYRVFQKTKRSKAICHPQPNIHDDPKGTSRMLQIQISKRTPRGQESQAQGLCSPPHLSRGTLEPALPQTVSSQPCLIHDILSKPNSSKDTLASQIRNIFISFPRVLWHKAIPNDSILLKAIHCSGL